MEAQSDVFIEDNSIEWENVDTRVKRKIFGYDEKIMMVKVNFDKGGIGTVHSHPHSQVTYVISGKFEVQVGDAKKILKAGDCFYIPPHIKHGAINLEPGELVDVFSPIREDFLT